MSFHKVTVSALIKDQKNIFILDISVIWVVQVSYACQYLICVGHKNTLLKRRI